MRPNSLTSATLATCARSFVLLVCAGSGSAWAQTHTWTLNADFDPGTFTNAVDQPADQVQLGPTRVSQSGIVWADNYYPAWVLKIDGATGRQLGRYDAALVYVNNDPKQGTTGARVPKEICNWSNAGNCPGRITTDTNADVWIINRAFGQQGSLSKFSGDISHCIDRNHNGVIDTSVDANNNGIIDPNDPKEFFGQNDECILTTIPIGAVNDIPRGVAVDRYGKIWVSTYNGGKFYRYDPSEPVTLEATVPVKGNPYSLATGGDYVFGSGAGGAMIRVNVKTLVVDYAPCTGCYGIVADPGGQVAWCGAYFSGNGVLKADFTSYTCTNWSTAGQVNTAVTLDLQGNVWSAGYTSSSVFKLSPAGAVLGNYPSGGGNPHGLSVDFQGFIWSVNDANATIAKIDPTGKLVAAYTLGGPTNDPYTPYLYSDFTGVQVNRQAPYTKLGSWNATWDSTIAGVPWASVVYNTEPQGAVPAGTTLKVLVRAADDMGTLATNSYAVVTNGGPLASVAGRYVQVEADMTGPGFLTPVLSDVSILGPCVNGHGDKCCLSGADCDDKNACTIDSCPAPGMACTHLGKMNCCNQDADCSLGNACFVDTCSGPGGTCSHAAVPKCCSKDADCSDGNLCHAPKCSGVGGMCVFTTILNCCNGNADCDDGSACTIDLCSGPGGTCSHFAQGNCCATDMDCADGNACHTNSCTGPGGTCIHANKPGCCNVNGDCDDGNLCHDSACSGAGGTCTYVQRMGCCNNAADCNDNDACTADQCSGPGGVCTHSAVLRCCNDASQCDDGDACTSDTCSGPGGSCAHAHVDGCCNLDGDCAVADVCVAAHCSGPGGVCSTTSKGAGCCTLDIDCDDKNICTTDTCTQSGSACQHDKVVNCCNTHADCPGNAMCTNNVCVTGDGSVGGGGGGTPGEDTKGCGCKVGGRGDHGDGAASAFGVIALLGLGLLRRRRAPAPRLAGE